jgi:hypothetical protein
MSRVEVFDPNEVATGHFYRRTVQRCFLMGEDLIVFVTNFAIARTRILFAISVKSH